MKLSVSLTNDDLTLLDDFVQRSGLTSRSAGVQEAIRRLRDPELENAYAAAWQEWEESEQGRLWDVTTADGLADAPR